MVTRSTSVNFGTSAGASLNIETYVSFITFRAFLFYIPARYALAASHISWSGADEVLAVLLAPAASLCLTRAPVSVWFAVLAFLGYASVGVLSVAFGRDWGIPQPLGALIDIGLDAKLLVFFLAFYWMVAKSQQPEIGFRKVVRWFPLLALINTVFVLRDLLVGGRSLFGEPLFYRYGFIQPQGLLGHHLESAWLLLFAVMSCMYFARTELRKLMIPGALLFSVVLVMHVSTKEIFLLALIWSVYLTVRPGRQAGLLTLGILAAGVVLFVLWVMTPLGSFVSDQIEYYLGAQGTDKARTAMTIRSIQMAQDFFPLGTGAGTFASAPSFQMGYSGVYSAYWLAGVWGVSRDTANFILDVFWPKVLGQTGYLGLAFYLSFLWFMAKSVLLGVFRSYEVQWCAGVVVTVLIVSAASSPFAHEILGTLFAFSSAFATYMRNRAARANSERPGEA